MKSIIFLAFATFFSVNVIAQNVGIGTATPTARLHIKGSADTTQLIVEAYSIQSNIKPLIKLRNSLGVDLMWIHSDHSSNIFIGINAGRVNIAGFGGESNTFIGSESGYANTFGRQNTTNGFNALYSNTIGVNNTATGASAIYNNNIGSNNTALGSYALYANTTSGENTAVGSSALYLQSYNNNNSSWVSGNVAVGFESLVAGKTVRRENVIARNEAIFPLERDRLFERNHTSML